MLSCNKGAKRTERKEEERNTVECMQHKNTIEYMFRSNLCIIIHIESRTIRR